jgi:hypothetical protein
MKIFIIGPEGSGKTVFMAMFSHFVATQRNDLELTPDDASSAKYVNATLGTLKRQEWPQSGRQGDFKVLCWNFGRKDGVKHRVELLDYAGQHIRDLLANDAQDKISQQLRQAIDNSDILIYMLNFGGFVDHDDFQQSGEDAWLLQQFLVDKKWRRKKRLMVISKADRFNAMAGSNKDDLAKIIENVLPEGIAIGGLRSFRKVPHYWITGVLTEATIEDDQRVVPIPVLPLQSDGFEEFVSKLIAILDRHWIWRWIWRKLKELGLGLYKWFMGLRAWVRLTIVTGIIVFVYALWLHIHQVVTQNAIITIITGTEDGAGTDSNVYLTIITKSGMQMPISLANHAWYSTPWLMNIEDRFENGATDTFEKRTFPVEEIDHIVVRIKNSDPFPAWKLQSISISDPGRTTEKFFDGAWFGYDKHNPNYDPWERTLYPNK